MESRDKEQDVFLPFPEPLREGVILARPNRIIKDFDFVNSDEQSAPARGRIRSHNRPRSHGTP